MYHFWKVAAVHCIALVMLGCATKGDAYKLYKFTANGPTTLRHGALQVDVEYVQSAVGATNYIARVVVSNTSDETQAFEVDALELVDESTGMTYPRLVPTGGLAGAFSMLEDAELKPGRKIQGAVYFKTAQGEARAKQLTLFFGDERAEFRNAGFLSDEELEQRNVFRDD